MEFIIVLASAIVYRNSQFLSNFQRDDWFSSWRDTAAEFPLPEKYQLWFVLLLPSLGLWFLLNFVGGWLLGLVGFVLALAVLFFSLGRFDFDDISKRYLDSMRHDDPQAALNSLNQAGYADPVDDLLDLHYGFEYELAYNEFQRWFVVIFWFLLIGPVMAFAYRLLRFVASESEQINLLVSILEWVPVRLLGLSWALVGNFDDLQMRWEDSLEHGLDSAASLNAFTSSELPPDFSPQNAIDRCAQLQNMFRRAAILWVVVAAILVLFI